MTKPIKVRDEVLLRAEKLNKLSSSFCPSPFKVVEKTGSEVTVKNDTGVEVKRNTAFVKKYNMQEGTSSCAEDTGEVQRQELPGAEAYMESG